jgi:hypothetical protein
MANDYLIRRELDEAITQEQLEEAVEASGAALEELRDEGVDIEWVDSEVMTDEEGGILGTFCHYRAESESAVHEHGDRAGLPVTQVTQRGEPLGGE